MITENELKLLGFELCELNELHETQVEYYYSYDIVKGLSLITNTNIEAEKSNSWNVELFNVEPDIVFTSFGEIQGFINNMERKIIKK